jgi:hypothetical protein
MPLPNITRTSDRGPLRLIAYGQPKVGKTTMAAGSPSPIFLRTEDGTHGLDVDAFDLLSSYQQAMDQLVALAKEEHQYQTVVVDGLDGIERLIWAEVVPLYNASAKRPVKDISEIPYKAGYDTALAFWQRFINGLDYLRVKRSMGVICLAHSIQRKVSPPDLDEYERYEPRIHHKAMSLITGWSDIIGFARHETIVRESANGKGQGIGTGRRLLCVAENPAYVAGNRYSIDKELPLTWAALNAAITTTINKETRNG